ncbi:MAG TPA: GAF domain-containing protein [Terriglobales bacterium]|jgi:GAF domain-containing protein|nr:GAF domain-containing protein [Terriglobales bacterium]
MPATEQETQSLLRELEQVAEQARSADDLMWTVVRRLADGAPKYNWIGFYMVERGRNGVDQLMLAPFVGAATPHTRIPLNKGICGAAASSGQTIVVDDVASDPRYLACSVETKSEIVAPVFVRGEVVGELDIDSHSPAAFGPEDRKLVEHCAALVGRYLEKTTA